MGKSGARAVLYVRVSTEEQVKRGFSVADQARELDAYAASCGLIVVERVRDEGYSGASPDRPGLARVMDLAEAGKIDAVVAVKRDRLFRSRLYRLLYEQDLEELGVRLVAINDTGHKLSDALQDELAAYERDQITERTNAGKRQKAREGKVVAGPTCLHGFRYSGDSLEVDEPRMAAIRRMFHLLAEGTSVSETARTLTGEGFPAPKGKKWLRPFVRSAVLHDAYKPHTFAEVQALVSAEVSGRLDRSKTYGIWWYNTREFVKTRKGRKVRPKPEDEWIAVPVPDAGVPEETSRIARESVSRNERRPRSRAAGRTWELDSGVIRCAGCGNALVCVATSTTHTLKSGERKTYPKHHYRCDTARRGQECPSPRTVSAKRTEQAVWEAVRGALTDPARLRRAVEGANRAGGRRGDEKRLGAILGRIEDLKRRRDNLIDMAADGDIPRSELREKLPQIDGEISALGRESRTLAEQRRPQRSVPEMEAAAPEELDALEPEGRRLLYRDLGLRVLLGADGSLEITWFAGLPVGVIGRKGDLSCPGSRAFAPNKRARIGVSLSGGGLVRGFIFDPVAAV